MHLPLYDNTKKDIFKEFLKFKKVFRLNRHHFERMRIDEKQHDSVYAKGKSMIFLWCKKAHFVSPPYRRLTTSGRTTLVKKLGQGGCIYKFSNEPSPF